MSEEQTAASAGQTGPAGQFSWHPQYSGRTYSRVHGDLIEEISRDQRSYKLAMDGAEQAEHDSLSSIVELDRRWSTYEFDWSEADPRQLADRILAYEVECERQQTKIPFAEYRASGALVQHETPATPETTRNIPVMLIGAGILVVLIVILIVIAVT